MCVVCVCHDNVERVLLLQTGVCMYIYNVSVRVEWEWF